MSYVRALTQECKPGTIEMLCREAEKTLVPHLRQIPGFLSYHIGKIDDRSLVAIGFCETREAAEALDRIGAEWRRQYGKDAIVSVQSHIGEVILEAGGVPSEAHPSP